MPPLSSSPRSGQPTEGTGATTTPTALNTPTTPHSVPAPSSNPLRSDTSARQPGSLSFARSCRLHYDFVEATLVAKAETLDRSVYIFAHVVFLIGFCFYFLYGLDVSGRYQLHRSLLGTLSGAEMPRLKTALHFSEVASAMDYGYYITYAVAPLLANVLAPTGASIPLGAMRVRTQRSITTGCDDMQRDQETSLYTIITCADSSVSSQEDTLQNGRTRFDMETLWAYKTCTELGGNRFGRTHGVLGSYHCGGFTFNAPLWVARGDANRSSTAPLQQMSASTQPLSSTTESGDAATTAQLPPTLGTAEQAFPFTDGHLPFRRISLSSLKDNYLQLLFWEASTPFLDDYATRMVMTEVLFYHPALQLFATVKLMGEVTSSGSWVTSTIFRTTRVWTDEDIGKGVYDVVVMLLMVLWCVWFVVRGALFVRRRVAERRCDGGAANGGATRARDTTGLSYSSIATARVMAIAEYVLDAQNLFTLILLSLQVTSAGFRIAAMVYCATSVPKLQDIVYLNVYPSQLEYLFFLDRVQLYVNGVILIMLFYRGLCFLTIGTHVARVVHLLARAQSALCGYLCLSLLVNTAFAVTLTSLYSHSVWAFRNVDSAFFTVIQVSLRQHDVSSLTANADNPTLLAFILYFYVYCGVVMVLSLAAAIMVHGFHDIRKEEPRPVGAAYQIQWLLRRVKRCLLSPRRWHTSLWRWCSGRGEAALLRHAARCLRAYRLAKYPALDHVEGFLRQLVSLDDFTEAMESFGESEPPSVWYQSQKHQQQQQQQTSSATRRSSVLWMTWTTRSTSDTLSSEVASGTGSLHSQAQLSGAACHSAANHNTSSSGGGGTTSMEWGKARAHEDDRELQRRRWQQRWGRCSPAEVWSELAADWLASTTSEAALHFREEVVWLRNGVQSAVGDNLLHAKSFPRRLAELERKLKLLEGHFRENELTAAASDKADREERGEGAG